MQKIDGFQTTDSFRFDRNTSSSSVSLSSSSGYGSRLSLSQADQSGSANRRISISKYFKEKLSRHKSLASLFPSPIRTETSNTNTDIYDNVWNLEKQIEKLRVTVNKQLSSDSHSIVSMSVDDTSKPILHHSGDHDLLSVAAWYQEGLPAEICEEYLNQNDQPIGSFIIRCNYVRPQYPFILSIKTRNTSIEHFPIKKTTNNAGYQIENSSKIFINLSTLVIHHTVIREGLPVPLVLPAVHTTTNGLQQSSLRIIRSVRF
ncbi:unnamed protein product [Adineta ricciae]|uniref:SH2 domain-containing protein n=1 Tax=Adineta ricciae TaxID=249248 RepID=A0A814HCM7_ADIRI|nr:unnamed protein product [Adineta ricciae]